MTVEYTTQTIFYRNSWINNSVGILHKHDGYDLSYMREFHILVRESCMMYEATLDGMDGGYYAVRFPS